MEKIQTIIKFAHDHADKLLSGVDNLGEYLVQDLSTLTPHDVGLKFPLEILKKDPRIHYVEIFQDGTISAGIFCMPPGSFIPLHDHPNMIVYSKVLYGTLRTQSVDWDIDTCDAPMCARLSDDSIETPESPVLEIRPTHFNLHSLLAITECAFIDIVMPPYNERDRPCRYYRDAPCTSMELPPLRLRDNEVPSESNAYGENDTFATSYEMRDSIATHLHLEAVDMAIDMGELPYLGPPCRKTTKRSR
eukprot:m.6137 g.6137  ORF g.6137 m.6137 type:complete len:247 (+) comp2067_c0_seq1:68-808(+)